MATITVSLPSDGDTIDAVDYNTPITTIVNDYNGNITNDNISASAAIAGSKLGTGTSGVGNANLNTTTGDIGGVRVAWTPTITSESGTLTTKSGVGHYTIAGKNFIYDVSITLTDAGNGAGGLRFTLPAGLTAANLNAYPGSGRENAATGYLLTSVFISSSVVAISKYDALTIIATGRTCTLSGIIELS